MTGPAAVLDALRQATGGHAEPAGDGDAVGGVPARCVAAPGSTAEAAAVLRVAAAERPGGRRPRRRHQARLGRSARAGST